MENGFLLEDDALFLLPFDDEDDDDTEVETDSENSGSLTRSLCGPRILKCIGIKVKPDYGDLPAGLLGRGRRRGGESVPVPHLSK